MDITITLRCNNNCLFCPRKDYLRIISSRSLEQSYKEIHNTRKISDKIVLSGGEVTLLGTLWETIELCKKINFKQIGIITNGRRLKDLNFAERLIHAGVEDFAVSIYSIKERIHDSITRSKGSCKETKQGIINLLKLSSRYDISLRVNLVLNYWNYSDIFRTLSGLYKLGIKNFILAEQIIINAKAKHLSLCKVKSLLMQSREMNLKNTRICLRGFAPCFLKETDSFQNREIILREKDPFVVMERQEIDTFIKDKPEKSRYLEKFRTLYTQIDKCKYCFFQKQCPGIQKAYILKS